MLDFWGGKQAAVLNKVGQALIPAPSRQRHSALCEFKVTLVYQRPWGEKVVRNVGGAWRAAEALAGCGRFRASLQRPGQALSENEASVAVETTRRWKFQDWNVVGYPYNKQFTIVLECISCQIRGLSFFFFNRLQGSHIFKGLVATLLPSGIYGNLASMAGAYRSVLTWFLHVLWLKCLQQQSYLQVLEYIQEQLQYLARFGDEL